MSQVNDFLDGKQPSQIDSFLGADTPKPSGAIRKLVGDKALGFASGAVGATKAITDAAGAGNAVSNTLADVNTGLNDYLSPEAKADQQTQSALMADAQGKGAWEGVKAGAKAFAVAPVQTAVQGLGSIVPIIAGTALTGGAAPAAAVGAGIGAAMGAGTAKGAIFDDIKKRSLASGMNEADATASATKAQEYTGANTDQIALGGALGAADALTGVSRIAGGMARGALRKPVAEALTNTTERGFLGRTAMGMASEMPLEAAQGGQEQVAANLAAQRAGFEAGTWDNVASNATLEALASAGPGAVFGAMEHAPVKAGNPADTAPISAPAAPALQIGNTPDPYISFTDGTVARQSEVDTYINGLPPDQQPAARAKIMGLAPQPGTPEAAAVAPVDASGSFSGILDTDAVYSVWSNTRDGSDRSTMRDQMDYVARTYGQAVTPENREAVKQDLSQQFKWFRAAPAEQKDAALNSLISQAAPVKPSQAMGLNPAAGPLSAAAVTAVDTGAHQANLDQQASEADQATYDAHMAEQAQQAAEQDTTNQPITHGPIAEAAMSAEDKQAILFSNKVVADGGTQYTGTQDGDILNGLGKPYPTRFAAQRRARMEGKDWSIAPVFDGFVARRTDGKTGAQPVTENIQNKTTSNSEPSQAATETVATEQANEWQKFTPETGTLNIPRSEMPQVKSEHRGAMVNFLNARGVEHESVEVDPASLKPTQAEFSPDKVAAAKEAGGSRAILISSDDHIIDGHHQALAKLESGEPVKAIRLDAPAADLIPLVNEFPSATQAPAESSKAPSAKKADLDHLFGVDQKRAKAIERIAKGTAYFSNGIKAQQFIVQSGLKDTHTVQRHASGANRYDVVTKPEVQPVSQPQGSTNGITPTQTIQAAQEGPEAPAAAGVAHEISKIVTYDEIDKRIAVAEKAGVKLSDSDKANVREALEKSADLNRKAGRISSSSSDPMNKGNAFPMGVGFTRETKRSNQRIDASVRKAGESVVLWKKAEQAEKYAEALLAGKNTEADQLRKTAKREEMLRLLIGKLESTSKGEKIGNFTIERVNKDRDGYPASYTISGDGIVKGVGDKVDVAREFFGRDKEAFRAMVDEVRTQESTAVEPEQPTSSGEPIAPKQGVKARIEQARQARADYFTPGNIVNGYGGHDEVLSYTPSAGDGSGWSVKVRAVVKEGGKWAPDPKDKRERSHATQPDARELKAGPVERLGNKAADQVQAAPVSKMETTAPENYKGYSIYMAVDGGFMARNLIGKNFGDFVSGPFKTREMARESVDSNEETLTSEAKPDKNKIESEKAPEISAATAPNETPDPADVLDDETALWSRITDGTATVDEFKAGFERWVIRKADILAALAKNKKDDLLKMGGSMFGYRNKSETKPVIVEALWRDGVNQYVLARSFSHGLGKNAWLDGVRNMVEATDAEQLAQYANDRKSAQEEAVASVSKVAEAIKDPQALEDFHALIRATKSTGKTFKEARLMLTPEQRARYDDLTATAGRAERSTRKEAQQDAILRTPGEAVTATEIIKTRHTKHGHDLWQFNLDQRVSGEEFKSLVAQAKRLGGDYSSYRGNGAIPGWQFRTEDAAWAFKALIAGDTAAAKDVMQERRDSFADDRSQSASERLNEMADRLDERADASLNQERKSNTDKRARQAASAEAGANAEKAMAKTMRNIAQAITDDRAKFLDRVRQKAQVEALHGYVTTAKGEELRAKYASYGEQEKHRGEAPTAETADFAEFPTFSAYRSDLATLARQLLEVDGTKLLGQRLLKEADDVSDAYTAFAKENFGRVAAFSSKGGGVASFGTRADAEDSIARSGYKGKAIAYQVKRGEHAVILSPSEAVERGIWQGDGDKRLTLAPDTGAELVEKIGKAARRGSKVSVPWQLETAHDRRKALARMGIETPAELRAALREFIALQEQAEAPSKVKQLERAMVGRRNDGLDFFPTPESVADEMVATAGIEPGMAVLEPSAGWGHIAERIRAAGVDPDVGEMSNDRRELLEAKGFNVVSRDFMDLSPRGFTYGDVFRHKDGTEGVLGSNGGLGSSRYKFIVNGNERNFRWEDREDLTGIRKNGTQSGYDRIIMNPPFSDGRDIQHVQHAYTLLKPGGRIVAIMGESAFTNQNKSATEFRSWLESVGGTEEKLAEGSFNDPSLPVNTGANARMVVIEKSDTEPVDFSRSSRPAFSRGAKTQATESVEKLVNAIAANWDNAPEIIVAFDMQDDRIPERVRQEDLKQRSGGAAGTPEGFYYAGKVYLMSSQLATPNDVARVLFHEALGHAGLRGAFGGALKPILQQIVTFRRPLVDAKIKEYGLRSVNKLDRMTAAEEVLAEMAQNTPNLGFVKRAIAAIRNWLRANVPGFQSMKMTDADIVQEFILPARAFVERGGDGPKGGIAFSRGTNEPMTNKDVVGNQGGRSADLQVEGFRSFEAIQRADGSIGFSGTAKVDGSVYFVNLTVNRREDGTAKVSGDRFETMTGKSVRGAANVKLENLMDGAREAAIAWANESTALDSGGAASIRGGDTNPTETANVQAGIEGKSLIDAARFIQQTGSPAQAEIAKQVASKLERLQTGGVNLRLIIAHRGDSVPAQMGTSRGYTETGFDDKGRDITVWVGGADVTGRVGTDYETVLHELVHAATMGVVQYGKNNPNSLTGKHVKDLSTVTSAISSHIIDRFTRADNGKIELTEFEKDMRAGANNAFRGQDEVLTWALTSPDAQTYLEAIPYQSRNLWSKLVQSIRSLLGLPATADTVLSEVLRISENMMASDLNDHSIQAFWHKRAIRMNTIQANSSIVMKGVNSYSMDGANPDIRFSRSAAASYAQHATDKLNETFSHPGKLNWWHKSFGTMNNLAERSPAFKPVFQAAQGFIDDTSYYATEAADMAPNILPKLEKWADLAKSPITAADNKAVSAPIFEGTLSWARDESGKPVRMDDLEATYAKLDDEAKAQMLLKKRIVTENELKRWKASPLDIYTGAVRNRFETAFLTAGVVWTDAELKSQFNLTPEQIKLYREFRSTVDKSLDNLAKADLLRFGGKDVAMLSDQIMDAKDADEAAVLLRDYLHSQRDLMPERADDLTAAASGMIDRADKVSKLKEQGYAPLSRFGKYTVDVVVNGERQYFSLFETERESNKMAAKMRMEYGTKAVGQGTLSESEFKLFAGITPESLELFGNMLGLDATGDAASDKAFQTYLKLTKTNRSAMRRMIHRKGIAGFSEDAGRVLASFVYSNARQTSAALHMGALGEAVNNIPKNQGELKDAAIALADYIKNPQEEAQAVRGLLFAQYLGGSISSAFVNMTQPFAVTFPWLSQFGGAKQSGAQLLRAMKDMAAKDTVYAPDLAMALKHAEEKGTVAPQEVHQLMAQARGAGTLKSGDGTRTGDALATASNAISKLSLGWGKVFGMAEQLNRRSTFIAAYRIAQAQNMKDPAGFAERAVNETQFIYSKANKMKFGRGAIGGTLMTFKTYSIAYLELLHRMATQGGPEGKKAVVLALAVMMLMGGSGGLPFMEDATDLVDGLLQRLGYNVSTLKAKQQFLEDLFGKTGADFIDRGVSGLPGMPLDVTGRLGMGNVIPGTGLFQSKSSHASDLGELVGPAGDLAKRAFDAGGKLLGGDVGGAALAMSPVAVRNAAKGADMASTGMYRDAKGYKVLDTTMLEAALKSIGFQPESVATVQEANYINQKAKNFYAQTASEIRSQWAKGLFEKDQDQIDAARERLNKWNMDNPDQRISANMGAILKRVHEMNKSKSERIAATAPKAMRASMRRDLAEQP